LESGAPIRYLVVIDGEHYPPVIASALDQMRASGHEIAGAVLAGGSEKLPTGGLDSVAGTPVVSGGEVRALLDGALARFRPDAVMDLSDEPVLDYTRRHQLAAVALWRGVPYEGADFRFDPPERPSLAGKPSIAIIGTGKRTGKTAVAGFAARTLVAGGYRPVIVAMGRGGPSEPEVIRGDEIELTPHDLLGFADAGKHAASDYIEDALLGRVATVGCRRCGGGLAGAVVSSNVAEGVAIANELAGDTLIFEGSGAAIPPVKADVTALVMPASIPPEHLSGYMGPYRLLLADLVVVTMCEHPFASTSRVAETTSRIWAAFNPQRREEEPSGEIQVLRTVFRPAPTRPIDGAGTFVATTAPKPAAEAIRRHLESKHGCRVVGISHSLSDRSKLEGELRAARGAGEVLLCEVKAAGVDVATRWALDEGMEVVYMDNVPEAIDGDDVGATVIAAAGLAVDRFRKDLGS